MELLHYFRQYTRLPEELEQKLDVLFQEVPVSKGQRDLEPDSFSRKLYFMEQGLARTFYYKDGKDITHYFFRENSFYTPIECTFYDKASPYGFEFLTKGVVRVVSFPELDELLSTIPELQQFTRQMLIEFLRQFSERLYGLQFQSAQERYQALLQQYPEILLQAPLGHIASYLGITQQTLSVIRSQK